MISDMVFSFTVECPRDGGRRFEAKETRTHHLANAGKSCDGPGRSVFARKHDSEDARSLLGVRWIFRSVDHLSIVVVDFPEKPTTHQPEAAEVVLTMRIVVRREVAE